MWNYFSKTSPICYNSYSETAIRGEYNTLRYEFTLYKIRDKRQIFDIPAALEESWDCSGDA